MIKKLRFALILRYITKKIDNNKFLIFSHYNADKKEDFDGFDCWLAHFENEKQIVVVRPRALQDIVLNFNLERDYKLIKNYVE